ncbi:MAG TPA: SCO family protein [Flavitalea sp.]|nr:SCO family protein [Flavitalea sp.]
MSKKALLALSLAVLLPVVSYLLVKSYSNDAIRMPPRFYADSISNKVVNGKQVSDTIWHRTKNIQLVNQLGEQVSFDDLGGKILVVDFFFTHCGLICPQLTKNMKGLQDALKLRDIRRLVDTPFVRFLSISIDPDRDSVPVLKAYSDKNGVNPDIWWLLTGPKKDIYDFSLNEMKLALQDTTVTSEFIHSNRFVLLDRERVIRGYYNGLDTISLSRLAEDLTILMLEKDKKKKRSFF